MRYRWCCSSMHTAWLLTISWRAVAIARVFSCIPVRTLSFTTSLIVVVTVFTVAPFTRGWNFTTAVTRSPAAQALCGIMIEYMSFSGHVFSISRVCWYSKASGLKPRRMVMG